MITEDLAQAVRKIFVNILDDVFIDPPLKFNYPETAL